MIEGLVRECRGLLAQGREEAAMEIASRLNEVWPSSQAEWQLVSNLFEFMKRPAWSEVFCERFLKVEPENASAQLQLARLLSHSLYTRDRSKALAKTLLERPDLTGPQMLTLANVLFNVRNYSDSLSLFRKILAADPNHLEARRRLISALIHLKERSSAEMEVGRLLSLMPRDAIWLTTVAEFFALLGNSCMSLKYCGEAEVCLSNVETSLRVRLFRLYEAANDMARAEKILMSIAFGSIGSLSSLIELLELSEKFGLLRPSLIVSARLGELEPNNNRWRVLQEQLQKRSAELQTGTQWTDSIHYLFRGSRGSKPP